MYCKNFVLNNISEDIDIVYISQSSYVYSFVGKDRPHLLTHNPFPRSFIAENPTLGLLNNLIVYSHKVFSTIVVLPVSPYIHNAYKSFIP